MKQCKVCGTLVHIDSNTCPSCGNHSFFVLDVKICPLCGKVNNITNSFCEQCGKPFITAQGEAIIKKIPTSIKRPAVNNVHKILNNNVQQGQSQELKKTESFELKSDKTETKPAVAPNIEENSAEKAYKDFIALKPDIIERDDYSEVSYYVQGDAGKLPVIILPKFAKTSGKNIIVNIVVQPRIEHVAKPELSSPTAIKEEAPPIKEDESPSFHKDRDSGQAKDSVVEDKTCICSEEEFKPFSAIGTDINSADITQNDTLYEDFAKIVNEDKVRQDNQIIDKAVKENKKENSKRNKKIKTKQKISAKQVIKSIFLSLFTFAALGSFALVFYNSKTDSFIFSGLSPILHLLEGIGISLALPFKHGYAAYAANYTGGQYAQFANLVPYLFAGLTVILLILSLTTFFSYRHKKGTKVFLVLLSFIAGLVEIVIALSTKYVFNSGLVVTIGTGLIVCSALTFVYLLLVLFVYKPEKTHN